MVSNRTPYLADFPERPGGCGHDYERVRDWLTKRMGGPLSGRWHLLWASRGAYFESEADCAAFVEAGAQAPAFVGGKRSVGGLSHWDLVATSDPHHSSLMMPVIRLAVFVCVAALVVAAVYSWRDTRVENVLEDAEAGEVLTISTDVCNVLRERQLIRENTDCGYRDSDVRVRLLRDP